MPYSVFFNEKTGNKQYAVKRNVSSATSMALEATHKEKSFSELFSNSASAAIRCNLPDKTVNDRFQLFILFLAFGRLGETSFDADVETEI